MLINEIFTSVQGEGPEIGKPTIFVRLSGCNLKCKWCDTAYALNGGKKISPKRLATKLKFLKIKHITWTGGEPALQLKSIQEVKKLLGRHYSHSIETNGTLLFSPALFNTVIISPKKEMINEVMLRCGIEYTNCYLKFVVSDEKWFDYWWDMCEDLKLNRYRERIYFMPEGTDNHTLKERGRKVVELCKKHNVNFSPRLQVWLWGNRKGV